MIRRNISLSNLKVQIPKELQNQINFDKVVKSDDHFNLIDEIIHTSLRKNRIAPSSSYIKKKYVNLEAQQEYQEQISKKVIVNNLIKEEVKQEVKKAIIKGINQDKFISPSTQYELKHLASEYGISSQNQHSNSSSSKPQSLFDLHKEFDQMHGTIVSINYYSSIDNDNGNFCPHKTRLCSKL